MALAITGPFAGALDDRFMPTWPEQIEAWLSAMPMPPPTGDEDADADVKAQMVLIKEMTSSLMEDRRHLIEFYTTLQERKANKPQMLSLINEDSSGSLACNESDTFAMLGVRRGPLEPLGLRQRNAPSIDALVISTPFGPAWPSAEQIRVQQARVGQLACRLNLTFSENFMQQYIATFGLVLDEASHNGFGEDLWNGMYRLLDRYRRRSSFTPTHLGWFLLPRPFSKQQAERPMTEDEFGETSYYPAFFHVYVNGYGHETAQMACLHILWVGCRGWWIHGSRMTNAVAITGP